MADGAQQSAQNVEPSRPLHESERHFRNLADTAPAMLWVTEPDGSCSFLSQGWYGFTGQTEQEGLGKDGFGWLDAVHPEDRERAGRLFQDANEKHRPFSLEYRLRRHDGEYRWAIDAGRPRFGSGGEFLGYIGSVLDITERVRAEEGLRAAEERQRLALSAGQFGYWQLELADWSMTCSIQCKANFGRRSEDQLTYDMVIATIHAEDRDRMRAAVSRAIQTIGDYEVDYRVLWPDGSLHWINARGRALGENGKAARIIGVTLDITDRKRAESMLAEHKHLLEKIATGCALDECLIEICAAVRRLNPGSRAGILLPDEERRTFPRSITPDLPPAFGQTLKDAPINDIRIGTWGEAIYPGEPITGADRTHDERWSKLWRDLRVGCGVLAGHCRRITGTDGLPLGSFFLCFGEARAPSDWELQLARFGADVAGIAIELDRANEIRRRDLEDAQRLQAISAQLIQENNVQALYERILDAAMGIMRSDFASMQMFYPERGKEGELRLLDFRGFTPKAAKFWEWVRPTSDSTCGVALRTGKQCIVPDVEQCEFMTGSADLEVYLQTGIHAVQTTPLLSRSGRLLGMISTHWKDAHRPSERDLRLFDVLARQAADLIERKQAEEALRAAAARDAFRVQLADALRPLSNPAEIQMEAARALGFHLGASRVLFGEAMPDGEHFLIERDYTSGVPSIAGQYRLHDFGPAYIADIRAGRTVVVDDVTADVRLSEGERAAYAAIGIGAHVGIPLMREGQFAAFGAAQQSAPRVWMADEVALIKEVSERTWASVERARAEEALRMSEKRLRVFSGRLESLVEERTRELVQSHDRLRAMATELNLSEQRERKRLATELHDHLQQMLVLGKLKLGQGKRLTKAVPAATKLMKETDDVLSDALEYTRTLVTELSPTVLRDHGLPTGLKWLGKYMQKHQLAVTVTVPEKDELMLPEDQTVLLFQSVRELLINSSKYAGTGQASVTLDQRDGLLRIEVRDEGVGFNLAAAAAAAAAAGTPTGEISSRFGLFSIEERMRALGGSFELESAPGKGTIATLVLPLGSERRG